MMQGVYEYFGPIYYFVFCFTSLFIILNILIAIISESYGDANSNSNNHEYELVDFMMNRFSKWSGINVMGATAGWSFF